MSLLEAVSSIVLHRSRCNLRKDGDTGRKELIAISRLEGNLASVSEGSGPYLIGRYANVTMAKMGRWTFGPRIRKAGAVDCTWLPHSPHILQWSASQPQAAAQRRNAVRE